MSVHVSGITNLALTNNTFTYYTVHHWVWYLGARTDQQSVKKNWTLVIAARILPPAPEQVPAYSFDHHTDGVFLSCPQASPLNWRRQWAWYKIEPPAKVDDNTESSCRKHYGDPEANRDRQRWGIEEYPKAVRSYKASNTVMLHWVAA